MDNSLHLLGGDFMTSFVLLQNSQICFSFHYSWHLFCNQLIMIAVIQNLWAIKLAHYKINRKCLKSLFLQPLIINNHLRLNYMFKFPRGFPRPRQLRMCCKFCAGNLILKQTNAQFVLWSPCLRRRVLNSPHTPLLWPKMDPENCCLSFSEKVHVAPQYIWFP